MAQMRKSPRIYRIFPPPIKYNARRTGARISIDQKSGCKASSKKSDHTIAKYGTIPSEKYAKRALFFFINEARKRIIPIFANSTG